MYSMFVVVPLQIPDDGCGGSEFQTPVRSKAAHHPLHVTSLMLSPSLGARWLGRQIGPAVRLRKGPPALADRLP